MCSLDFDKQSLIHVVAIAGRTEISVESVIIRNVWAPSGRSQSRVSCRMRIINHLPLEQGEAFIVAYRL
jgi:hypothetical protein